jgi:hypothetical protein
VRSTATRIEGPAGACAAKEQTDRTATKEEIRVRRNLGTPSEKKTGERVMEKTCNWQEGDARPNYARNFRR